MTSAAKAMRPNAAASYTRDGSTGHGLSARGRSVSSKLKRWFLRRACHHQAIRHYPEIDERAHMHVRETRRSKRMKTFSGGLCSEFSTQTASHFCTERPTSRLGRERDRSPVDYFRNQCVNSFQITWRDSTICPFLGVPFDHTVN